jgi:uroporphyrinogen decarboxylase
MFWPLSTKERSMTAKERITLVFRNEEPDRVPVSPELWDVIPIRVSGRPFWEVSGTSFGKKPLWQAQLEAYRFFGCEAWIPVAPGPSKRQTEMVRSRDIFDSEELIKTDMEYVTSQGVLHETKLSAPDYDLWSSEAAVKDVKRDFPALEEFFFEDPESLDYTEICRAYEQTGDDGICEGIVGDSFFEFVTLFREGGAVQAIYDLHDFPEYFTGLRQRYMEYMSCIAESICRRTPADGIFLNCGSSNTKIISPDFFRTWDIPVIESVAAVAERHGKIFHYHLHGQGAAMMDDLHAAGVTVICPFEPPPKGDFVLAEMKQRYGSSISIKGGLDPFLLCSGKKQEIEKAAQKCIEDAGDGGGYTLATADGVLKETPFENIRLLVKIGKEFGRY